MAGRKQRDPVSVSMDPIAEKLLRRCYADRGTWHGTYLANPGADWMLWASRNGLPVAGDGALLGPDPVPGRKAKTRWARALVRAAYQMNRLYMTREGLRLDDDPRPNGMYPPYPLRFEVGSVRIAPGGRVVGRAVRFKLDSRGTKAYKEAVAKVPESQRWADGGPMNAQGGW